MDTDEAQMSTDVLQGWAQALTDKRKIKESIPSVVIPVSSIGHHLWLSVSIGG
ncbi:hypothetical protein IAD21_05505 [Abditibacteriota bacterium]|nr:hypothetical protein IAD21_05505 [Abditibacteriota bacterium]